MEKDPKCTIQLEPFDALGAIATERGQDRNLVQLGDELAKEIGGPGTAASYRDGVCAWCGKKPEGFTDAVSAKEWAISRLCQSCQDRAFAEPEEDDNGDDQEPAF